MHVIGMEMHKNYSAVAVTNEQGDLVERCRLNHRHREELIGYFNQFPSRTQVVMEATCGWGWLSELLQDLGLEVKLANPSKVKIVFNISYCCIAKILLEDFCISTIEIGAIPFIFPEIHPVSDSLSLAGLGQSVP